MRTILLLSWLLMTQALSAQNSEVSKLMEGELKMTFPSIYFVHNSTDYAKMPYSVDSCLKYIAANIKYLNSMLMWRDTTETELLAGARAKKIKLDLNKYVPSNNIKIQLIEKEQKLSQRTINKATTEAQRQYLLSFNAVLDVSGAIRKRKKLRRTHVEGRLFCIECWQRGAFWKKQPKPKGDVKPR